MHAFQLRRVLQVGYSVNVMLRIKLHIKEIMTFRDFSLYSASKCEVDGHHDEIVVGSSRLRCCKSEFRIALLHIMIKITRL